MKLIRRLNNNRYLNADAEFVEVTDWESAFKYGYAKLQQVFGDRLDQSIADATLNGLKDKYPDNPKVVIGALKYGHQSKDEEKNSRLIRNYIINSRRCNSVNGYFPYTTETIKFRTGIKEYEDIEVPIEKWDLYYKSDLSVTEKDRWYSDFIREVFNNKVTRDRYDVDTYEVNLDLYSKKKDCKVGDCIYIRNTDDNCVYIGTLLQKVNTFYDTEYYISGIRYKLSFLLGERKYIVAGGTFEVSIGPATHNKYIGLFDKSVADKMVDWIKSHSKTGVNSRRLRNFRSTVQPKSKYELIKIVEDTIYKEGTRCNLNFIDTSLITDMSELFMRSKFNGEISKWDVSQVKDMSKMFNLSEFDGDISNWNTSNVEDMSYMFSYSKFEGDISNWDVSNVRYMNSMFHYSRFNGGISKWNVSNVETMSHMFEGSIFNKDISKWDVSKVQNMCRMFANSKFTGDISKWDISNVKNMDRMFLNSKFTGDISNWNTSNVEDMDRMFESSLFNEDISNWDTSKVKDMTNMFYKSRFNGYISDWNVSSVRSMDDMFKYSPLENNPPEWYRVTNSSRRNSSRFRNSAHLVNSVRIKPEDITVVSIKDLLESNEGRRFLGLYPKLSRIITVLIEASHSEGFIAGGKLNIPDDIYLVNYKLPKRFANDLEELFAIHDYTDIYSEDYSAKMKDTLCSTQGIFFKGVDSNTFSKIVLNKYSMPDLNVPETYMDINPLTLGGGDGEPGPMPETYDTVVSRHVYDYPTEIHEPKVTVKLPIDPKISLI